MLNILAAQQKANLELCLLLLTSKAYIQPLKARPVMQVWAAQQDPPGGSAVACLGLNKLLIPEFAKPSEISS